MDIAKSAEPFDYSTTFVPVSDLWPLSVDRYHAMIEAGLLTPDDKIELLEGQLIQQISKNPPHSHANAVLYELLLILLINQFLVRAQEPITLRNSEPEPDLVILRGERAEFAEQHPKPEHVALVVEISQVTLQRDRTQKMRIYADAGIGQYWIVNLIDQQVEVYTRPQGSEYAQKQTFGRNEALPIVIDGIDFGRIDVAEFLPS